MVLHVAWVGEAAQLDAFSPQLWFWQLRHSCMCAWCPGQGVT